MLCPHQDTCPGGQDASSRGKLPPWGGVLTASFPAHPPVLLLRQEPGQNLHPLSSAGSWATGGEAGSTSIKALNTSPLSQGKTAPTWARGAGKSGSTMALRFALLPCNQVPDERPSWAPHHGLPWRSLVSPRCPACRAPRVPRDTAGPGPCCPDAGQSRPSQHCWLFPSEGECPFHQRYSKERNRLPRQPPALSTAPLWSLTSWSLRLVSPPNMTVADAGAACIFPSTVLNWFARSSACPRVLSRWEVIRHSSFPDTLA